MQPIVTKKYLQDEIAKSPSRAIVVIGRALVAIFNNQMDDEKRGNITKLDNGIGFSQSDARIGSLGAKYYLKHKTLQDWQIKPWLKLNSKGEPRIVKYAKQLNAIALHKRKKIITVDFSSMEKAIMEAGPSYQQMPNTGRINIPGPEVQYYKPINIPEEDKKYFLWES